MRPSYIAVIGIVVGVAIFATILTWPNSTEGVQVDNMGPHLVFLLVLLAFIAAGVISSRPDINQTLKSILFWGGLFILLVAGYAIKNDLLNLALRTIGAIAPGLVFTEDNGNVSVVQSRGGHFFLNATVEGKSMRFLVDTGASVSALTAASTEQIGYRTDLLNYVYPVSTASGRTLVAQLNIDALSIGEFVVLDTEMVAFPPNTLNENLLGIDILNKFRSWRIEGDRLILVP